MLRLVRVTASLAISTWGLLMAVLGIVHGVLLWIALGVAVLVAGLPLLASHPRAAARLYLSAQGPGRP